MNLRFSHLAVIGLLAAAFALAGCGRKGPLDPPPAEGAPASTKADKPARSGAGLNPLQSGEQRSAAPAFDADGKPLANANARKKQLPMDWLID